mmetsp:Transcript_2410/g.4858  ORF Transcript_2410/g.4858 Transcript_2410/m.4858 type:complete len:432 (+) Transcript_2410:1101-2396(+)
MSCPTLPNPEMITWPCMPLSSPSLGANAFISFFSISLPIFPPNSARNGVSAIERATTRYISFANAAPKIPLDTASPYKTNANSPPGDNKRPDRKAWTMERPNAWPTAVIIATLPTINMVMAARTLLNLATSKPVLISIPTVMKKRPINRPLYGAISLSTWIWNSVSARSKPAKNAPKARDNPATWVMSEVPKTMSRVSAAKISALFVSATRRYNGLSRVLPATMMLAMHTIAFMDANPIALAIRISPSAPAAPSVPGASRGISIKSTTTARSCKSKTLNAALPCREPVSPLSCNTCIPMAVVDNANPPPKMTAAGPPRDGPSNRDAMYATAARVMPTWAVPMPNTNFCIDLRRSNESSRPMLKSKKTTPNSARWRMDSTSWMIPKAYGPINAPPAKNPSTGDPPGNLHTNGTVITEASNSQMVSRMPASLS